LEEQHKLNKKSSITAPSEGILKVSNQNLIEDFQKELIVMGRNTEIIIEKNGTNVAMYKIPYGSKLFAKPDQPVKKGQKIISRIHILFQLFRNRWYS